jgi:hypothetical protein
MATLVVGASVLESTTNFKVASKVAKSVCGRCLVLSIRPNRKPTKLPAATTRGRGGNSRYGVLAAIWPELATARRWLRRKRPGNGGEQLPHEYPVKGDAAAGEGPFDGVFAPLL